MTTAAEAFAACLALGASRADCDEVIRSHTLPSGYCDGTIVYEAGQPPRCVSAADVRRKLALTVLPPPPTRVSGARPVEGWVYLAGGVLAIAGCVYLLQNYLRASAR